jgi:hypothetical protein
MTMQFPVADQTRVNAPLLASEAEWVSPGYDDERFAGGGHPMAPGTEPSRWLVDPPPADGAKVVISDTDHYAPGAGDAFWAWKSFLRGHHPILMDFGLIAGVDAPAPAFEPARLAMGDTLRFAGRVDLVRLRPLGELSSTGYALADPGREYLVLAPEGGRFGVHLEPGDYAASWFGVDKRDTVPGEAVSAEEAGEVGFEAPAGPAVLHLKRTSS